MPLGVALTMINGACYSAYPCRTVRFPDVAVERRGTDAKIYIDVYQSSDLGRGVRAPSDIRRCAAIRDQRSSGITQGINSAETC